MLAALCLPAIAKANKRIFTLFGGIGG